jgi:5-methylcytosine-specific restriction endonuclease McrA
VKKTLLLNADGKVLSPIPWTKAVKLLWKHVAMVIVEYDRIIRSPSVSMNMPAVIILKKYAPVKYKPPGFSKKALLIRDRFKCQYCGCGLDHNTVTKDHVIPQDYFKKGKVNVPFPPTSWRNIVASCRPCNNKKRNRSPREAGMKLINKPRTPKRLELLVKNPPKEWVGYVNRV